MDNRGRGKTKLFWIFGFFLIAAVGLTAWFMSGDSGVDIQLPGGTGGVVVDTSCDQAPNFKATGINKYTAAALTESVTGLKINDEIKTNLAGDTNKGVSAGNLLTGYVNASGYYATKISETIPCEPTVNPTYNLCQHYNDGSSAAMASNFMKDPTDTTNSGAANYSMSAATIPTFKWHLDGVFQKCFGNPEIGKNIVTVVYNSSSVEKVTLTVDKGTLTTSGASTPDAITIDSEHKATNWIWDKTFDSNDDDSAIFSITIDADDTYAPGDGLACGEGGLFTTDCPTIVINDIGYFVNQDKTGSPIETGWEDEDKADVGMAANLINDTIHWT